MGERKSHGDGKDSGLETEHEESGPINVRSIVHTFDSRIVHLTHGRECVQSYLLNDGRYEPEHLSHYGLHSFKRKNEREKKKKGIAVGNSALNRSKVRTHCERQCNFLFDQFPF